MTGHDALGTVGGAAGASFLSIFKGEARSLERAQKVIFVPSIKRLKTAPTPPQPDGYASSSKGHGNSRPVLVSEGNVGGARHVTEQKEGEKCTHSRLVSPQIGRLPLLGHID